MATQRIKYSVLKVDEARTLYEKLGKALEAASEGGILAEEN